MVSFYTRYCRLPVFGTKGVWNPRRESALALAGNHRREFSGPKSSFYRIEEFHCVFYLP